MTDNRGQNGHNNNHYWWEVFPRKDVGERRHICYSFSRSHCYCQMVHKVAPWLLQIAVVGIPTKNRASMRERCISKTTTTGYAVRDSVDSVFPTRITFHAPEAPERSRSVGWWLASHAFYRTVVPLPPDRLTWHITVPYWPFGEEDFP